MSDWAMKEILDLQRQITALQIENATMKAELQYEKSMGQYFKEKSEKFFDLLLDNNPELLKVEK